MGLISKDLQPKDPDHPESSKVTLWIRKEETHSPDLGVSSHNTPIFELSWGVSAITKSPLSNQIWIFVDSAEQNQTN